MSIVNEIERLQVAKADLKTAIERRGGALPDTALIDEYGDILNSRPFAVKGAFTPEEDTRHFSISGLLFKPKLIYLYCHDLVASPIDNTLIVFGKGEGVTGIAGYCVNSAFKNIQIVYNTTVETWTDSGYEISFPSDFAVFKAGYTYEYYIAGGFGE